MPRNKKHKQQSDEPIVGLAEKQAKARRKAAAILGSVTSRKKTKSCRVNGLLGGRPKGSKNAPRYYQNV